MLRADYGTTGLRDYETTGLQTALTPALSHRTGEGDYQNSRAEQLPDLTRIQVN